MGAQPRSTHDPGHELCTQSKYFDVGLPWLSRVSLSRLPVVSGVRLCVWSVTQAVLTTHPRLMGRVISGGGTRR